MTCNDSRIVQRRSGANCGCAGRGSNTRAEKPERNPGILWRRRCSDGYGAYSAKIIAEIVDAYQLSLEEILERASYFKASGADIIDLGCPVQGGFPEIGKAVKALKTHGFLVSVDSFNPEDILNADQAGVDYVLSVNSQNIELARRLRCKVVVIPDFEKG